MLIEIILGSALVVLVPAAYVAGARRAGRETERCYAQARAVRELLIATVLAALKGKKKATSLVVSVKDLEKVPSSTIAWERRQDGSITLTPRSD